MQSIPNRPNRIQPIIAAMFVAHRTRMCAGLLTPHCSSTARLLVSLSPLLLVSPSPARADIFQWEYINPADPSQGKQQSTTLAPDGAGVDAVPGAYLNARNLTMAYLIGADLTGADGSYANLTNGDLSQANLNYARLTGADFTGADIRGATFFKAFSGTGITLAQLYSTASYQAHDLTGIGLGVNDLAGGNFAGQNLTNAYFADATLTDADFTNSRVEGADLSYSYGFTAAQLYSTASYQARDLTAIRLEGNNDLSGVNFTGQNLTNASFVQATLTNADLSQANLTRASFGGAALTDADLSRANVTNANFFAATLTGADFTDADVRGAHFDKGGYCDIACQPTGTGITLAQLYSTASYRAHNLTRTSWDGNNLSGANFAAQNLSNAGFGGANLTGANFRQANLGNALFFGTPCGFEGCGLAIATLSGADFTDAEVRGANFFGTRITPAQLYSTGSYQAHDLTGIGLAWTHLTGDNFAGQNLTNADFSGATLTGADFTGAEVRGANFDIYPGTGITLAQLYSTASYQAHDLSGIGLASHNLTNGNFAGQNLTNAYLYFATLTGADFTGADARGAGLDLPASAITINLISSNGHIGGLVLDAGGLLVVRDYDGRPEYPAVYPPIPITVDQHLAMGPGGTLRMVFEADDWDSTISFAPGIPVALGGTLELTFADDVNLASQVGRTLDLFDWTGVTPTGAFAISSPYAWNLSNLYTTGEVTLIAVPEPSTLLLFSLGLVAFLPLRRVVLPRPSRVLQFAAADFTVWRDTLGAATLVNRSPYIAGPVGLTDYAFFWKANFGSVLPEIGAGSGSALPSAEPLSPAVPEPASIALATAALGLVNIRRRRRPRPSFSLPLNNAF